MNNVKLKPRRLVYPLVGVAALAVSSLAIRGGAFAAADRAGAAAADSRPDRPPTSRPVHPTQQLAGVVTQFNLSPRAEIDGLMLKDNNGGRLTQINLPPRGDWSALISQNVAVGDQITVAAIPIESMPDHPIYGLASLTTAKGQEFAMPTPEDAKAVHLDSTVKALNYSRDGRPDGVTLDSGEYVPLGPIVEHLKLAAGSHVTVEGKEMKTPAGKTVVLASLVNGEEIPHPRRDMGPEGGPHTGGPDGHGPDGHRPGGRGPDGHGPDARGPRGGGPGNDGPSDQGPQDGGPQDGGPQDRDSHDGPHHMQSDPPARDRSPDGPDGRRPPEPDAN